MLKVYSEIKKSKNNLIELIDKIAQIDMSKNIERKDFFSILSIISPEKNDDEGIKQIKRKAYNNVREISEQSVHFIDRWIATNQRFLKAVVSSIQNKIFVAYEKKSDFDINQYDIVIFDADKTIWTGNKAFEMQPPFIKLSEDTVKDKDGRTVSLIDGVRETMIKIRALGIDIGIISHSEAHDKEAQDQPVLEILKLLGIKDLINEKIVVIADLPKSMFIPRGREVLFIDDDNENLLNVFNNSSAEVMNAEEVEFNKAQKESKSKSNIKKAEKEDWLGDRDYYEWRKDILNKYRDDPFFEGYSDDEIMNHFREEEMINSVPVEKYRDFSDKDLKMDRHQEDIEIIIHEDSIIDKGDPQFLGGFDKGILSDFAGYLPNLLTPHNLYIPAFFVLPYHTKRLKDSKIDLYAEIEKNKEYINEMIDSGEFDDSDDAYKYFIDQFIEVLPDIEENRTYGDHHTLSSTEYYTKEELSSESSSSNWYKRAKREYIPASERPDKPNDGKEYELDHKKPRWKGGKDTKRNLHWVEKDKHKDKSSAEGSFEYGGKDRHKKLKNKGKGNYSKYQSDTAKKKIEKEKEELGDEGFSKLQSERARKRWSKK